MEPDELLSPIVRPNARGDEEASQREAIGGFESAEVLAGLREIMEDVLSTLPPREKEIIKMRFGLDPPWVERTATEVGAQFKVTGRRLRQIEEKVLAKIRYPPGVGGFDYCLTKYRNRQRPNSPSLI